MQLKKSEIYTIKEIEERLHISNYALMRRVKRIFLMRKFPLSIIQALQKQDVTHYLALEPLALQIYHEVKKSSLYTRNCKMESRVLASVYLIQNSLYPNIRSQFQKQYIIYMFLIVLFDALGDTIADEFEGKTVKNLLKEQYDITGAKRVLQIYEQSLCDVCEGVYRKNKIMQEIGLDGLLIKLQDYSLYLHLLHPISDVTYKLLVNELKEGVRYIFSSFYISLQSRECGFLGEESVTDHVCMSSGAIGYYILLFIGLMSKADNIFIQQHIQKEKKTYRLVAVMLAELTYFVDGYKSFMREFREGDFSSWVYNYCVEKKYLSPSEVQTYVHQGLQEKSYSQLVSGINMRTIYLFLIQETARRIQSIQKKGKSIITRKYLNVVLDIMAMQLESGQKEEKEQLAYFMSHYE